MMSSTSTSSPPLGGVLGSMKERKNRNKKGLLLGSESAKPGTLSGTSVASILSSPSTSTSSSSSRPQPIQVSGSSRSNRSSLVLNSNSEFPTTPNSLSSTTSTSSNSNSGNLGDLELGVEFKLDLRNEDLKVINELGSGNGGTVSKCLHLPTQVTMAKKVVHIQTSSNTRKQILRELQIMHDCSSRYIVSFYGAYLQDPHICMCMEFMDKGSLDTIYKKFGPIPEQILGKIAFAVVKGLTYLYEVHKIMHRDVKPSNILLNSSGQIKICDFGVSGELINSVADTFVGTSTYMSPERISGDPYSVKSDVWSLGITLVELAIGRFPFSSDDDDDDDDDLSSEEEERKQQEEVSNSLKSLSLDGVAEEAEDLLAELGEDTLSPSKPHKKRESIALAEEKRLAKAAAAGARTRTRTRKTSNKKKGVSLAGSGHQMSILELLQYIVNEPAPRLPKNQQFSKEMEQFVDATLRKEPVGYNAKKKGPLPTEIARPTPKELLVS
jgi:mitogen-activated protein kinase kinase